MCNDPTKEIANRDHTAVVMMTIHRRVRRRKTDERDKRNFNRAERIVVLFGNDVHYLLFYTGKYFNKYRI